MYHYIRPLDDTPFPNIKALDLKKFKSQLQHFDKYYNVITHQDVIDAITIQKPIPDNSVWLTFDDGYKDHINYAIPLLEEFGFFGSFFPPAKPIKEGKLLDVNAIHYILAQNNCIKNLLELLNQEMFLFGYNKKDWMHYWNTVDKFSRFDNPEVIFFKRMLQRELPEKIRNKITTNIFEEIVNIKESNFVKSLYMTTQDLELVKFKNHGIGSHTYSHRWLSSLNAIEQEKEINISINFLEELGVSINNWMMCYPYGNFNETTINLLKAKGCCLGLTTSVGQAKLTKENSFTLQRFDTNDYPQ
jgi:peptidoglycan/xylan/chitin deacetylase (PgdA/CDA1 family)